ncbi:MAG: 50S ribosomal protein L3 [Candidatus Cloacimonadota bacterium]|nr:MAG: 50S ribosomal protein L3 [Candidatus Cloacimonadota bacterium]
MIGLIGKKIGMTRIFDENGNTIPVTVIQLGTCTVVHTRSVSKNGYSAVQLGFGEAKKKNIPKPLRVYFEKNNLPFCKILKEFRISEQELSKYEIGAKITPDIFTENEKVDVSGISKGKGFAGVMKRYNFKGFSPTHGVHESFRGPGSIGQCATPSRVFKGKKLPGHMGNNKVTVKNLRVVKIKPEGNFILLKGAMPGHRNSIVTIEKTK